MGKRLTSGVDDDEFRARSGDRERAWVSVGVQRNLGVAGRTTLRRRLLRAIDRLTTAAENIGADAVIDLRIDPIQPSGQHGSDQNYSVFCYGTAVKLKDETF